ncbi:MAG: apolipoprotein N-acyltransferase [gamma proteobacterium symbiont of Stewartia floridana]|nr:MAG: apolipoprotein N-acyltransferase [gamma proteobacterium symbiont of Stewartia floridana]
MNDRGMTRLLLRMPAVSALLAGGLTTLAFAPFDFWIMGVLGPMLLFLIWQKTAGPSFRSGFFYGFGLLGSGVSWLYVSIAQFGDLGWLFPLVITLGFILFISLYYGLLGWLARQFDGLSAGLKLVLIYPALWVSMEWFRGWFLTGFPWLQPGYSQLDSPLAGYAPLLGVLGVSWMVLLTAGLLSDLLTGKTGRTWRATLLLLIWLSGWWMTELEWSRPAGEPLSVALVQGNIPQAQKWLPEQLSPSLVLYANLTKKNLDRDLIIWPETAVSAFQFQVEEAFIVPLERLIRESGSNLVFGVVQMDAQRDNYYNALVSLGNEERDHYYKGHLVPFTEYLPFKSLLWPLVDLFTIPMSDFAARQAPKPLMRVGDHTVGMSICYEDAFGSEMILALPEAAYLINVSNDAWFGDSLAPHQHLQIARMRALESSRYLLRSTNTGVSAIIAPNGKLAAISPLLEEDVLQGEIVPLSGQTPYARSGNLVILLLLLMSLAPALVQLVRQRRG